MWVHWVDAYGTLHPRGWQATMLRMEEPVDRTHNIEYAPTMILQELLVRDYDQSKSSDEYMADNISGSDNSGKE